MIRYIVFILEIVPLVAVLLKGFGPSNSSANLQPQKVYGSDGSQALDVRPFGEGQLEIGYSVTR